MDEDAEMKGVDEREQEQDEVMVQREERGSGSGGGAGAGAGGGERQVQIHPLVIVNIADHHTRHKCNLQLAAASSATAPGEGEPPRAIGALFGVQNGLDVAVVDSFEIKYDVVDGAVKIDKEFLTSRTQQCTPVL